MYFIDSIVNWCALIIDLVPGYWFRGHDGGLSRFEIVISYTYTFFLFFIKIITLFCGYLYEYSYSSVHPLERVFTEKDDYDIIQRITLLFTEHHAFELVEVSFVGVDVDCLIRFIEKAYDIVVSVLLQNPLVIYGGVLFCLSTLFSLFALSYLGLYGVFIVNLISLLIFWFFVLLYSYSIFVNGYYYYINFGCWMYLNHNFKINFEFLLDSVSMSFVLLTTTIAIFVYMYTFSYFRYEPLVERLILFLNAFIISMVFLVSSGNLIMVFLGWELIGLTSFLLINF